MIRLVKRGDRDRVRSGGCIPPHIAPAPLDPPPLPLGDVYRRRRQLARLVILLLAAAGADVAVGWLVLP